VLFHDTVTTIARLQAIRDLGVRIAIDDFGTGYSSLGYLSRFRVDILKIAREFVGSADKQEEWAFAGAIVALGRTLGLTVIAEGIEDEGQLQQLRGLGCALGQGYLFARPADAETISVYLEAHAGRRPSEAPRSADDPPAQAPSRPRPRVRRRARVAA
jgi:EAL domain-containing protein (putative c-di-GMP-specific phosphodiesterase class I)